MTEELLPCPFCGGEAKVWDRRVNNSWADMVECEGCPAKVWGVEEWNTRPSQWNADMSAAPRDGTRVLIHASEKHGLSAFQCVAAWHEDAGWCVDELRDATHWMPLPQPPEEGE